jgi:autotransporter-associated beta strand protein
MNASRLPALLCLSLVLLVAPPPAPAQTTNTYTNVSGNWADGTNWSGGVFPNATDSAAVFTNAVTASWTNTNITVGSILASNASGSVVVGNNTITNDVLTLATASGKPVLQVSNSSAAVFMYANIEGTNGFTKTGGGRLTFRFNGSDMAYTGGIQINAGTLGIERDGSLGNASNSITFGGNSTLLSEPGANSGTVTLASTRTITISNGVTANFNNGNAAVTTAIDGTITGAGNLVFLGTGTLTLNASNSYTGTTTLGGGRVNLGSGATISTNTLALSNSPTVNFGGGTHSVASLTLNNTNPAVGAVVTLTNGTLNVGGGANLAVNGTNGSLLNMSGLTAFSFAGAAGNRTFSVQPNTSGSSNTNEIRLAAAGDGSNNISASTITVGGATGSSSGNLHQGRLLLGKVNNFSATTFSIGGFNGEGVVEFQSGITNGTTSLRGSNGIARMGNLTVGSTSSGVRSGAGTFDVGTVDASISNTFIGVLGANANNIVSNRLTMAGGTFDTLNLTLGAITNTTISSNGQTSTAIFQQNGGTVKVQSLVMGDTQTAVNTNGVGPTYLSTYNLSASNAVLQAQTIRTGTSTNYSTNTVRKINFGAGTIRNYDPSTDLTISGLNSTVSGRLEIAVASNSSARTFSADANRKITIESTAVLTSTGNIVKTGTGTLILNGANTYSGGTEVREGTLSVFNTSGSATGSGALAVSNGATLTGTGIIGGPATIAGALKPGSSPGDLTFNDSLTLESSAVLTLEITGTAAAGQFDRLIGAGTNTFTLGGTLSLDNTGFTPVFGQTILVFSNWGSFSGSFATITGADLGGGLSWDTGNLAVDGTMQVIPEPRTYALLALAGGGAFLWRLRRRGRR